jgi:hypothetical protein
LKLVFDIFSLPHSPTVDSYIDNQYMIIDIFDDMDKHKLRGKVDNGSTKRQKQLFLMLYQYEIDRFDT